MQSDTLRLDTTHADTYNLVGFRWMLALMVDFSAQPRSAHPRAKCYKCYNVSIPHTQGWPLMSFRPPATLTTRVSPLYVRLTDSLER